MARDTVSLNSLPQVLNLVAHCDTLAVAAELTGVASLNRYPGNQCRFLGITSDRRDKLPMEACLLALEDHRFEIGFSYNSLTATQ